MECVLLCCTRVCVCYLLSGAAGWLPHSASRCLGSPDEAWLSGPSAPSLCQSGPEVETASISQSGKVISTHPRSTFLLLIKTWESRRKSIPHNYFELIWAGFWNAAHTLLINDTRHVVMCVFVCVCVLSPWVRPETSDLTPAGTSSQSPVVKIERRESHLRPHTQYIF